MVDDFKLGSKIKLDDLPDDVFLEDEEQGDGFQSIADNFTRFISGTDADGNNLTLVDDLLKNLADSLDPSLKEENARWKPQDGPQSMAFYSEADELFYGGAAGGGKMLECDCNILTPFGWKKAEEIKVGDTLVAYDGTATKVLAVYNHTNIDIYKFTFSDGATITVSDDHLWAYWKASFDVKAERQYLLYSPEKGIHKEYTRHRLGITKELYKYHQAQVKKSKKGGRPYWIIMPLCDPVRFTRPNKTRQGDVIRIAPYLLGLLIGDGSITYSGINITTIDEPIKEYVQEYAKDDVHWDSKKHLTFRGETKKELEKQLDSYGLFNCKSDTKFIPENYLFASLDVRYDLMAGLIDTDGYIDDRGHISYTTISEQLAKDVQHLARSLGCKASISTKEAGYKDGNGDYIECNLAYNVWIQGPLETKERFSKLPRKQERIKPFNGDVSEVGRRVTDIEYVGKGDGVCFAIDHPQGLHVVQDFIVTHNTDLMLGLALSEMSPHKKAIIFRRSYPELKDIVRRGLAIVNNSEAYRGGNAMRFDTKEGKTLELGSVVNFSAAQKYKGRPHDLKLFDEVSDLSESVYSFLIGWARTTEVGVPVRVVAAGNPPTTSDGNWVIRRWAPWLDPHHPDYPAAPGELRYFATLDGEDKEITEDISPEGHKGLPFTYTKRNGEVEEIRPKSRTFIPARLDDNAYLRDTDYRAVLQNMPEPYRSQLLYGDFGITLVADPWQVIPTEWIHLSNQRWEELRKSGELKKIQMADPYYGLDVAEAGSDYTAFTKLTQNAMQWIEYIKETDTMKQADWVNLKMSEAGAGSKRAPIAVDAIGPGLGLAQRLNQMGRNVTGVKVSRRSTRRDKTGQFGFSNLRSQLWWKMREAFDPDGDIQLAIPAVRRLAEELTAPRFELDYMGNIKIEPKEAIREKLGRSPDGANALMLALYVAKTTSVGLRMI